MIKLQDIIKVDFPEKTKVKFNMHSGIDESSAYQDLLYNEKMWNDINAWRQVKCPNSNLDYAEYLLAFAQYKELGNEYYVFGGYYKIVKIFTEIENGVGYKLELLDKYKTYRKKLIIKNKHSKLQAYNRWYNKVIESLQPEIFIYPNEEMQEQQIKIFNNDDLIKIAKIYEKEKTKDVLSKVYIRNPFFREYALRVANGKCQLCGMDAPFKNKYGEAFLEVHHIIPLSSGGEDDCNNVVALCPNCHRKMHILNLDEDIECLRKVAKTINL